MLSFIMSSSGIHHARVTEVNKQLMGYIIPIGWWLVIAMMVTLVGMYVWYWVSRKIRKERRLGHEAGNSSVYNGRYCEY